MKITDFLCSKAVTVDLKSTNKVAVVEEMVELLSSAGAIEKKHRKKILDVLMAREDLGSTAIGQGIAIPHGKCEYVKKIVGCFGISKSGINFESLDGDPSFIFFLLVAPIDSAGPHLKALARISRLLKDKYVRDNLKSADDNKTVLSIIQREDGQLAKL